MWIFVKLELWRGRSGVLRLLEGFWCRFRGLPRLSSCIKPPSVRSWSHTGVPNLEDRGSQLLHSLRD